MSIAALKAAAAEIRRIRGHRMPPYTEDLCKLVESLEADSVLVARETLKELDRLERFSHEIRDRDHPRMGLGDGERASLQHAQLIAELLKEKP